MRNQPLLILGASGRAAARAALAANLDPTVIDLFADYDTKLLAEASHQAPREGYPGNLLSLAQAVPPMPWIMVGGLENHPELITQLARQRRFWGIDPQHLPEVRDLTRLQKHLAHCNWAMPETTTAADPTANPQDWLMKGPSSGGLGVRKATAHDCRNPCPPGVVRQRFIPGTVYSAQYCSSATNCQLMGITQQFVGESWLNAPPLQYCGNLVQPNHSPGFVANLQALGTALSRRCHLLGLWGMDFILTEQREVFALEVNPRYTAAMEILEAVIGVPFLQAHRLTCTNATLRMPPYPDAQHYAMKAIYYTPETLQLPEHTPWAELMQDGCNLADLPQPESVVPAGAPLLTILAKAKTQDELQERFLQQLEYLKQIIAMEHWAEAPCQA